jgi:hypothetical protein
MGFLLDDDAKLNGRPFTAAHAVRVDREICPGAGCDEELGRECLFQGGSPHSSQPRVFLYP